jgi:MYXO-CTERM domain-containing protein
MNVARFLRTGAARSRAMGAAAGLLAFGLALFAQEGAAAAFCRSTTCTGDCPRDEDGCKTTGQKLFWASRCVGFSVQRDGTANLPMEEVRPVIEAGFLAWTDLPCEVGAATIAFSPLDDVSCHKAEYDAGEPNANVVMFQDSKWEYSDAGNNLAKTTVTYDKETGEILDADIELNFAFNELTVGDGGVVYDLASIVTHEIGHFIGLDHSPDPLATMFAGYDEGSTIQRTLEDDDIAGACEVYPPGRDAACAPLPKNGLGDACAGEEEAGEGGGCAVAASAGGAAGSGWWWAAAAACAAGALRSRRRSGKGTSERST